MPRCYRKRDAPPAGFTLIEVLLAIGLSSVLLALLGASINLYLMRVDASRSAVEQAQLARGVMRVIADDLRNAAVLYEQDISSAEAASEAQALFDVTEADATPPTEESEETELARPYVGVYGTLNSLHVDVLRVRPAYRASQDNPDQPITLTFESPGVTGVRYLLSEEGLVRQQVMRGVSIYQEQQGLDEAWSASSRVIAPEVVDVQFRFSDGEQTLEYWDLEEQEGASPLAVEVRVGIRETVPDADAEETSLQDAPVRYYRIIAPIPQPPGAEEASEEGI